MEIKKEKTAALLIVEDSPTQLLILKNLLAKNGFHVERAVDGEAALSCARNSKPDLIISDIFMPKMNGYDGKRSSKLSAGTSFVICMLNILMNARNKYDYQKN